MTVSTGLPASWALVALSLSKLLSSLGTSIANVWDSAFALEKIRNFDDDLARSRRVTAAEWRRRPFREKAAEWLAGLLRQQL